MNFIAGEILGGCGVLVAAPPMHLADSAGRSVYLLSADLGATIAREEEES